MRQGQTLQNRHTLLLTFSTQLLHCSHINVLLLSLLFLSLKNAPIRRELILSKADLIDAKRGGALQVSHGNGNDEGGMASFPNNGC